MGLKPILSTEITKLGESSKKQIRQVVSELFDPLLDGEIISEEIQKISFKRIHESLANNIKALDDLNVLLFYDFLFKLLFKSLNFHRKILYDIHSKTYLKNMQSEIDRMAYELFQLDVEKAISKAAKEARRINGIFESESILYRDKAGNYYCQPFRMVKKWFIWKYKNIEGEYQKEAFLISAIKSAKVAQRILRNEIVQSYNYPRRKNSLLDQELDMDLLIAYLMSLFTNDNSLSDFEHNDIERKTFKWTGKTGTLVKFYKFLVEDYKVIDSNVDFEHFRKIFNQEPFASFNGRKVKWKSSNSSKPRSYDLGQIIKSCITNDFIDTIYLNHGIISNIVKMCFEYPDGRKINSIDFRKKDNKLDKKLELFFKGLM